MKESLVLRLVSFSVRHSWIVILIAVLLSVFLGYHALHIQVDADIFNMIPRKSKVIEDIEKYSTNWDTGQILIAVEGPELFELQGLQVFDAANPHPFSFLAIR